MTSLRKRPLRGLAAAGLAAAGLALVLLAAPAARAEDSTLLTALAQIPAEPALYGEVRMVDVVDLAALKQASGIPDGLRLTDLEGLPEPTQQLVMQGLFRISGAANFLQYLLIAEPTWPEMLGVDFLELGWFSQPGTPPNQLVLLGGEALPRGEALSVLASVGLAPEEHEGATFWVKGEKDNAIDVQNRFPGFPFWGELGSSVRLHRSEAALVGARSWPLIELAREVASGEAASLADLPAFRLAVAAASDPSLSDGPVIQMSFVDESFGRGVLGLPPAPEGLPPFGLYAFADREDASGHQVVLVLTYDDPLVAKQAAARLSEAVMAYGGVRKVTLAERFPGIAATHAVVRTADGAAAVVRLAIPPLPGGLNDKNRLPNRSQLYRQFYEAVTRRDAGYLAVRE